MLILENILRKLSRHWISNAKRRKTFDVDTVIKCQLFLVLSQEMLNLRHFLARFLPSDNQMTKYFRNYSKNILYSHST